MWSVVVDVIFQPPSSVVSSQDSDKYSDDGHEKCTICLSSFENDEPVRCVFYM